MTIGYILDSSRIVRESFIREEMAALRKKGHRIILVPLMPPSVYDTAYIQDRTDGVDALSEPPPLSKTLFGALRVALTHPFFCFRASLVVRRYIGWRLLPWALWAAGQLRRRRVDRLHTHFVGAASIRTMALARILGIPFSCTGHGSDVLLKRHDFFPELAAASKPFITISQFNKQQLISSYGLNNVRIEVVHCGVDLDKFQPRPRPATVCPFVLSVTWLIEVKGVDYLFGAVRILKERGRCFTCSIVGGGRDEQDFINAQQKVERLEISDLVSLVRRVPHPEICAYMQKADLFVLPSLSEGIPVSLMEAMAMELPVVATRISGIPELVDHEVNGLLVEPGDAAALAEQMERLMEDEPLRRRLGRAACDKIARNFNLDIETARLQELFTS